MFSTIMADFLKESVIKAVEIGGYHGHVGDALVVRTRASLPIAGVTLALLQTDGTDVEVGAATNEAGEWRYVATKEVPAAAALTLEVRVTDADGIGLGRTLPVIVA